MSCQVSSAQIMFADVWRTEERPYPFQVRVTELLAQGKRVILQAPTGAGKTRAALTAYMYSRGCRALPAMSQKCLYAVPMRVLATQFHTAHAGSVSGVAPEVTIQTGEQPRDPRLEGDLVFLTIDQLLSSFLTMPYGLPARLANLNAGALVGAYIVLDEFHLFDPSTTLSTSLEMLARLEGLGPVLVMTATFSGQMLGELARILKAEVVSTPPDEVRLIETCWEQQAPRQRTWRTAETPLTGEAVLAAHQPGTRTLVVCNRVDRAQALYDELSARHPHVVLLHSRFLPEDRRRWEDQLRQTFDRGSDADAIAVATQVVEVGLDISAHTLHTELAPAASLIQRAGRCARYPGEMGTVWIYPTESTQPYARKADDPVAIEMAHALTWLSEHSGEVLTFSDEQALIDAVCTERDERILAGLSAAASIAREAIDKALSGDPAARQGTQLVRDADSRRLLIHDQPDVLLASPYSASSFAVHPTVLMGALPRWQQRAAELGLPWAVRRLADRGDQEEGGSSRYQWCDVADRNELWGAGLVAVHPALAGYDPHRGLLLRESTAFCSVLPEVEAPGEDERHTTSYRLEPYAAHVQHLLAALEREVAGELYGPAAELERLARWPAGSLGKAAWLVCALHDVGKLSRAWQGWARTYQEAIGQPISEPVAHTCFDSANPSHRNAQQAARRRPNHAAEGAVAVLPMLVAAFAGNEALVRAAVSAIARHHGPFTGGYTRFRLEPSARAQVQAALQQLPREVRAGADVSRLLLHGNPDGLPFDLLPRPGRYHEWLAYTLVVRALRRADQAGTAAGAH